MYIVKRNRMFYTLLRYINALYLLEHCGNATVFCNLVLYKLNRAILHLNSSSR